MPCAQDSIKIHISLAGAKVSGPLGKKAFPYVYTQRDAMAAYTHGVDLLDKSRLHGLPIEVSRSLSFKLVGQREDADHFRIVYGPYKYKKPKEVTLGYTYIYITAVNYVAGKCPTKVVVNVWDDNLCIDSWQRAYCDTFRVDAMLSEVHKVLKKYPHIRCIRSDVIAFVATINRDQATYSRSRQFRLYRLPKDLRASG